MSQLNKFLIKNNINRNNNLIVVLAISLISFIGIYLIKSTGLKVSNNDYFFVIWFIMSLYYIYLIADISAYDFDKKVVDFTYSVGFSRSKYILNKIILFLLIGLCHGIIIYLVYKGLFLNLIINDNVKGGASVIIIYGFITLLIGAMDNLLAILRFSKSKILMINCIVIIILPMLLEFGVSAMGNNILGKLLNISPITLISSIPMSLEINYKIILTTIVLAIIFNGISLKINNQRDF